MFLPDYFQPPTTQLRQQAITTWQHWQPRLTAAGIATIGVMVIAIAATIESGRKTRDGWEWLYPRLLAAYQAFKNYQEPRFQEEEAMVLPDPSDCFGEEYLPFHSNFKDFVKAVKEQDEPAPAQAPELEPEALSLPSFGEYQNASPEEKKRILNEELRQTNANYFPNPYEAVERELLETLIAACQQPEETILHDAPAATAPAQPAPATAKRRGRAKKTAPGTAKD